MHSCKKAVLKNRKSIPTIWWMCWLNKSGWGIIATVKLEMERGYKTV
jgi:hypothetical protein